MKDRIVKYGLIENIDYQALHYDYLGNLLNIRRDKFGESENQHVSKIEYVLSIDAAKELSMVEGNEKGKEARRYFITCEKIALEKKHLILRLNFCYILPRFSWNRNEEQKLLKIR